MSIDKPRAAPPTDVRRDSYWRGREVRRQNERKLPVWNEERWWRRKNHIWEEHFPHVSEHNPAMIAWTESADKGERDIQTRARPGRYLKRYFADILSDKEIAALSEWHTTGQKPPTKYGNATNYPLVIATTEQEIVAVYMNGPHSCMDGTHFTAKKHPCRIYAAGDLALAWLHRADDPDRKPVARCLIWPEKKIAGRVYPSADFWSVDGFQNSEDSQNCNEALFLRLKAEGYKFTSENATFDGARLKKIAQRNDDTLVVMPYLDNGHGVTVHDDHFVISRFNYDYECADTSGWLSLEGENNRAVCDHCGDSVDDDDMHTVVTDVNARCRVVQTERWCPLCEESYSFRCEGTQETVSSDVDHTYIHYHAYTMAYLEAHGFRSDYSDEWFVDETPVIVGGENWSRDEFVDNGFTCEITDRNMPNDRLHELSEAKGGPLIINVADDLTHETIHAWLVQNGCDVPDELLPEAETTLETIVESA